MIAIDPGLRGCGVASFRGERLIAAAYVISPNLKGTGVKAWLDMAYAIHFYNAELTVVEQQRLRPGNEKGNPQNMMEVEGVVGAIAARFSECGEVIGYYPEAWKGSVKKEVMTVRITKRLSKEETEILARVQCPPSLMHNVIDGIGIGLFHLGRLKHERTIARS